MPLKAIVKDIETQINDHNDGQPDELVVFYASSYEDYFEEWKALEAKFPAGALDALKTFYQLCDGFSDRRYTAFSGIEDFIENATASIEKNKDNPTVSIGDGNGMDEKAIYLLGGKWFKDGQLRFMFEDYVMGIDSESLRELIADDQIAEFKEDFPLYSNYDGPVDEPDEAEFVSSGPFTLLELLEYVHETGGMI